MLPNPDYVWRNARLATMRADLPGLGVVERGAIASFDSRIVYAGPEAEMPADVRDGAGVTFDLEGRWVTPGLIDPHTHLVYAGDRSDEFERRLAGESYEQVAAAGGGILSTVRATRAAGEGALCAAALKRLDAWLAEGVTTIEVKSGYGLDFEGERKMLRVARQLGDVRPIDVRTAFLGLHALPPEARGDRAAHVEAVIAMLPRLAAEKLVDAADAFCERVAFAADEVARVFDAAQALGLPVKLHADQLSDGNGAALAARHGALSADHVEHAHEGGVRAMASAGTVATLLPGAFYFLRETHVPPVELFRAHGVPMALGTDHNPGSSPLPSVLLAANLAATLFRMTVDECLLGLTRHAARALGLQGEVGTLERGKWANLAVWDVERLAELVYRVGGPAPLHARVWRGRGM